MNARISVYIIIFLGVCLFPLLWIVKHQLSCGEEAEGKITFQGKRLSYEEALPLLEKALDDPDRKVQLEAVGQLALYGDSIKGSKTVDKLIVLYQQVQAPKLVSGEKPKLTPDEELALELKGEIFFAIAVTGDARREKLLEEASQDTNEIIRELAEMVRKGIAEIGFYKRGGIPAKSHSEEKEIADALLPKDWQEQTRRKANELKERAEGLIGVHAVYMASTIISSYISNHGFGDTRGRIERLAALYLLPEIMKGESESAQLVRLEWEIFRKGLREKNDKKGMEVLNEDIRLVSELRKDFDLAPVEPFTRDEILARLKKEREWYQRFLLPPPPNYAQEQHALWLEDRECFRKKVERWEARLKEIEAQEKK